MVIDDHFKASNSPAQSSFLLNCYKMFVACCHLHVETPQHFCINSLPWGNNVLFFRVDVYMPKRISLGKIYLITTNIMTSSLFKPPWSHLVASIAGGALLISARRSPASLPMTWWPVWELPASMFAFIAITAPLFCPLRAWSVGWDQFSSDLPWLGFGSGGFARWCLSLFSSTFSGCSQCTVMDPQFPSLTMKGSEVK